MVFCIMLTLSVELAYGCFGEPVSVSGGGGGRGQGELYVPL